MEEAHESQDVTDPTFSPLSLTGSQAWVAARLGRDYRWFSRNKASLEKEGFPKRDPIVGQWIKADVDAWIARRRKFSDDLKITTTPDFGGIDLEAV